MFQSHKVVIWRLHPFYGHRKSIPIHEDYHPEFPESKIRNNEIVLSIERTKMMIEKTLILTCDGHDTWPVILAKQISFRSNLNCRTNFVSLDALFTLTTFVFDSTTSFRFSVPLFDVTFKSEIDLAAVFVLDDKQFSFSFLCCEFIWRDALRRIRDDDEISFLERIDFVFGIFWFWIKFCVDESDVKFSICCALRIFFFFLIVFRTGFWWTFYDFLSLWIYFVGWGAMLIFLPFYFAFELSAFYKICAWIKSMCAVCCLCAVHPKNAQRISASSKSRVHHFKLRIFAKHWRAAFMSCSHHLISF